MLCHEFNNLPVQVHDTRHYRATVQVSIPHFTIALSRPLLAPSNNCNRLRLPQVAYKRFRGIFRCGRSTPAPHGIPVQAPDGRFRWKTACLRPLPAPGDRMFHRSGSTMTVSYRPLTHHYRQPPAPHEARDGPIDMRFSRVERCRCVCQPPWQASHTQGR